MKIERATLDENDGREHARSVAEGMRRLAREYVPCAACGT